MEFIKFLYYFITIFYVEHNSNIVIDLANFLENKMICHLMYNNIFVASIKTESSYFTVLARCWRPRTKDMCA